MPTPTKPLESTPIPAPTPSKKVLGALVVLVLIAGAVLAYFGNQYVSLTQDPNEVNQQKIEAVVQKVERLIDLPQGEVPTLATVSDTDNLADQPFFRNASVGDQVLLYTNARKAYLYSPMKNIIVEVASLNIGQ